MDTPHHEEKDISLEKQYFCYTTYTLHLRKIYKYPYICLTNMIIHIYPA